MIPVLAVPVLHPYRVAEMLATVDVPCGRRIVVDNGGQVGELSGVHVIRLPWNLGVGAAWNLAMKATPDAEWWALVNDDVAFAPGDLARLCAAMDTAEPRLVTLDGFSAFGINRAALDAVGWFDENFHPAYCEDADYEYRCRLRGVPIMPIPANLAHRRSSTISDPAYGRQNDRTYPRNVAYYARKWGGGVRGGERFASPFDSGAGADVWTLDPARLREQGWETTMLDPAEDEVR